MKPFKILALGSAQFLATVFASSATDAMDIATRLWLTQVLTFVPWSAFEVVVEEKAPAMEVETYEAPRPIFYPRAYQLFDMADRSQVATLFAISTADAYATLDNLIVEGAFVLPSTTFVIRPPGFVL